MNVTEKKSDGLEKEYEISIPASEIQNKVTEKLNTVRAEFQMKGFRKGKAPIHLIRQMFGQSIQGEAVQETVESAIRQHMNDNKVRPSMQPEIKVENETLQDGENVTVLLAYEQLPEIPKIAFKDIELEKMEVDVSDEATQEALENLAKSAQSFDTKEGPAEEGDQVVIDFTGSIDGENFEGGAGTDHPLVLGSNSFIPGFEEQLIGTSAHDEKDVKVNFPDNYGAQHLAGKEAVFKCTVKEVKKPADAQIDDELAKKFGSESLEDLKSQVTDRLKNEYQSAAMAVFKRKLLDALDEKVTVDLPKKLVKVEANQVAHQLFHDENPDVKGHDHEKIEPTEKHNTLAERRVKLGLIMAHVGDENKVSVDDNEVNQAVMQQAMQYRGQEKAFFDHVRNNPQMLQQFRAPLYEAKVVNLISELVTIKPKKVTQEELEAALKEVEEDSNLDT